MTSGSRNLAQKSVAVVVIVTLLNLVGVSPLVMMFVTGVVLVVWVVSRRSHNREVERIFEFYRAADAILREEERRWYGFEVAEVIEEGERALDSMPDPPPLHLFVLGALYHRLGNYEATNEYLSRVTEDEQGDEGQRTSASPQLRRYVAMLRRIEHQPAMAPRTLGAVRSLERARQKHASQLLADSRRFLKGADRPGLPETSPSMLQNPDDSASSPGLSSISAPPPISEVLQDIYHEDTSTTH